MTLELEEGREPGAGRVDRGECRWRPLRVAQGLQRHYEGPHPCAQREPLTTVMLSRTVRYDDKLHMEDEKINRKLLTSFLTAVVDCH